MEVVAGVGLGGRDGNGLVSLFVVMEIDQRVAGLEQDNITS